MRDISEELFLEDLGPYVADQLISMYVVPCPVVTKPLTRIRSLFAVGKLWMWYSYHCMFISSGIILCGAHSLVNNTCMATIISWLHELYLACDQVVITFRLYCVSTMTILKYTSITVSLVLSSHFKALSQLNTFDSYRSSHVQVYRVWLCVVPGCWYAS